MNRLSIVVGLAIGIAIAVVLLIVITRPPHLTEGDVMDKRFDPAHDTTALIPQYMTTCSGKPLVCTSRLTYFLPITTHHPDQWSVLLRGDCHGVASQCREEWVSVSSPQYDATRVGDHVGSAR